MIYNLRFTVGVWLLGVAIRILPDPTARLVLRVTLDHALDVLLEHDTTGEDDAKAVG